ncbi:type II secretion system F family protein [uncultured Pseudodesulfovibrio sp.]|uniref:type II secretion system F family protein n=1 Tax=uncultured Pseudodesulfovibrio sp. TaxID=2035858 RepID=UPI0029C70566|nr:type II secretion system F family protein [uncultured Pseudodesulfovibrio sp.]
MSIALIITVVGTLVIFMLAMGVISFIRADRDDADRKVKDRLRQFAMTEVETQSFDLLLAQSSMSQVPWFNRMLSKMQIASNISRLIRQGKSKGTTGTYLLLCALLGMIGAYVGIMVADRLWIAVVLAGLLGYVPILYLRKRKESRMTAFHKQLPEVLDLMSRALKAGHTFGGAMRMVSDEFDDPIGGEFRQTLDEINFGMDVDRALDNLLERVDVADLKFFAVSVNIQRETGGNLAEIVSNIARLVRERFVLFGKVRVLSAEGRLSALLLSALPFITAGILYLINPGYMSLMWTTELGLNMSYGALFGMTLGIICMRRMVNIKV